MPGSAFTGKYGPTLSSSHSCVGFNFGVDVNGKKKGESFCLFPKKHLVNALERNLKKKDEKLCERDACGKMEKGGLGEAVSKRTANVRVTI